MCSNKDNSPCDLALYVVIVNKKETVKVRYTNCVGHINRGKDDSGGQIDNEAKKQRTPCMYPKQQQRRASKMATERERVRVKNIYYAETS